MKKSLSGEKVRAAAGEGAGGRDRKKLGQARDGTAERWFFI